MDEGKVAENWGLIVHLVYMLFFKALFGKGNDCSKTWFVFNYKVWFLNRGLIELAINLNPVDRGNEFCQESVCAILKIAYSLWKYFRGKSKFLKGHFKYGCFVNQVKHMLECGSDKDLKLVRYVIYSLISAIGAISINS